MTEQIAAHYIGFQAGALGREYTFAVRDAAKENIHYILTISNEAFASRRVRYQDGAEICSLRLRRELETHANHPPTTSFSITDVELADYRDSHAPRSSGGLRKRRDS